MESTLIQIFKENYNRDAFVQNVLIPIFKESVKDFELYDADGEQELELSETEKRTAKRVVKYGEFNTHDNRKIELYEVTVEDYSKVKIARVGLGAIVKKLIIGNNAAFATFKYEDVINKHWRFSFIAYDSFFEEGKVQTKETNPKRYTYVFGDEDETYRTAIDRFKELDSKFQIKVKDIQDAFAVEAMSKEFFDEYRETHYANFVKYLTGEEFQKKGGKYNLVKVQNPSLFLASVFNGDKKDARDFCKKLLGQIVFLYFIQKKGWLGAKNISYKEGNGDKNFIQNFFKEAGENDSFYPVWLSKLFYATLNQKRTNDDFTMPDGKVVKIPYLNGGLFEKESEKFDHLVFPSELFADLFEFFNRFNFTIYENSPEEHTIAVDPEMLGHIFENLLEDNKDKGAFYTPKEIVQYMTQESLIEYLATHLGVNNKESINQFVKQKNKEALTDTQLNEINNLLDKVKICDPAIGSGAFPMGMLQEIFAIKERIAFDLGFIVWSPATVKENIIQNSIYGVDIEKGAVDIAQLRFWLSLIVDEEEPKPLPNLAYKIVVGNSLVSKFGDEIIEIDWEVDEGTQSNLFGNPYQEDIQVLLKQISKKQKEYFTANNSNKPRLTKEIRLLKLNILSKQLELMISTNPFDIQKGKKLSNAQKHRNDEIDSWKRTLKQINVLKTNNKLFHHFDWRLDFPEILNPIVNENTGFDIVIANPPYLGEKGNKELFQDVKKGFLKKHYKAKMDLFYFFFHISFDMLKEKGISTFITTNYYLTADGAVKLRESFKKETSPLTLVNFNEFKIFDSAYGQHNIVTILQKSKANNVDCKIINTNRKALYDKAILSDILLNIDVDTKYFYSNNIFEGNNSYIRISSSKSSPTSIVLSKIKSNHKLLKDFVKINSGCDITISKVTNKHLKDFNGGLIKNEGVFVLTLNEFRSLNLNEYEKSLIKPFVKNSGIKNYIYEKSNDVLIYTDWETNIELIPNIVNHLKRFKAIIDDQKHRYNEPTWPWFSIHRPREIGIFNSEDKIIVPYRSLSNNFAYSKEPVFSSRDVFFLTNPNNINTKYLLALLNSKLIYFWLYNKGKRKGETLELYATPLSEIPISQIQNESPLIVLVSYLLFLFNKKHVDIISHTSNERIASHIQEVLDMMIYELYFEDHMKEKGLNVLQFINPQPIEDVKEEIKIGEIIKDFYLWYQKPENEVRQRILLIETRSKDTLAVIRKSVN
ncbi:Eco57I restriction-modification methylase domain-containing protein [Psychroserpens luteus]|uniref:site-specific DNA-methyltransferase (adenine-specific) n=1 Tax=Psychroserpens luteus TaxID=1434066 RepID=A0ABW5ZTG6_9FLAO|nr:TaqI-like C-terminal specificity domain-containing protein [Psychroserpens luteus]